MLHLCSKLFSGPYKPSRPSIIFLPLYPPITSLTLCLLIFLLAYALEGQPLWPHSYFSDMLGMPSPTVLCQGINVLLPTSFRSWSFFNGHLLSVDFPNHLPLFQTTTCTFTLTLTIPLLYFMFFCNILCILLMCLLPVYL